MDPTQHREVGSEWVTILAGPHQGRQGRIVARREIAGALRFEVELDDGDHVIVSSLAMGTRTQPDMIRERGS